MVTKYLKETTSERRVLFWAYVLRTYSLSWWKTCGHKIGGVPLRENRKRSLPGSQTSRQGSRGWLLLTRLHLLKLEQSSQTVSRTENQDFGHRQATPMKSHQLNKTWASTTAISMLTWKAEILRSLLPREGTTGIQEKLRAEKRSALGASPWLVI